MKLAVFDIDGTLTLGDGLGTKCFFGTFDAIFGSHGIADRRLDRYAESTDCGIAREAVGRALGREPHERELEQFKSAYLELLASEIALRDGAYRPVAGAERILLRIASHRGWHVEIATGNWRRAAALKLGCAGIACPPVTACSEDGASRAGILRAAVAAATTVAGQRFEHVVYVGDQPWDLRAAREIGVAFLGIGSGDRRRRLEIAGAVMAENYADEDRFCAILDGVAADPSTSAVS